ncbi:MAG: hypothetical protein DHS20C21_03850 [Gemmatimonadota bacterium]|nr:MAG: hypothetical protein DHS20C21_03850 [Gemmatimonadota bacterium]
MTVLALLWGAVPSLAQDRLPAGDQVHERLFEFSPFAGWLTMDDNLDYEGGAPLFGVRGVVNNSQRWSFEGEIGLAPGVSREVRRGTLLSYSPHVIYGLGVTTSGAPIPVGFVLTDLVTEERIETSDSNLLLLSGSMRINFSSGRWRPFVKVGGGLVDDLSNRKENPEAPLSDPFGELGIGLSYLRPSGFGVRLDVTDRAVRKNDVPRENPRAAHVAGQLDFGSSFDFGSFSYTADGQDANVPYSPVNYNGQRWLNNIGVSVSVSMPWGYAWKDGDGDGVETRFDECPTTAPGVVVDGVGCGIDTDKDGVYDGIDTCPDTPIGALVDLVGCPSDIDNDGVFDGIDVADDTPPGALVDDVGQHYDTDGDGVLDGLDQCNDTPLGASINEDGCVDDPIEDQFLRGMPIVVSRVAFERGTDEIDPTSYHYVNKIARLVERWTGNDERPLKVELGMHTDGATGTGALSLSQRRADKIRLYLVNNFFGIGANNLSAVGYGDTQPVAATDTADGRAQNSRLEVRFTGEGDPPEEFDFGASFDLEEDLGDLGDSAGGTAAAPIPTPAVDAAPDAATPADLELELPDELDIPEPDFPDLDEPEN